MTRNEALARARDRKKSLRGEILSLRSQVGTALNRSAGGAGININLGVIDEEYVPELKRLSSRISILDRMANDPVIRGQLRAIMYTLISGVRWKVDGGTQENQDLLRANLLREGPRQFWCSTSWIDRLYETLGCLIYGFAMFGKTREDVDGNIIFADLKWLHPRSLDTIRPWVMDDQDNLQEVNRYYQDAAGEWKRESIPATELFIVPWDRRGPNWEGNAFIRPMYKPWKMMDIAEKIDLIDLQNRGVGIPLAKLSGQGGIKERDTLVEILKSLRGGSKERQFIVLDKDEDVSFLTSQGQAREAQTILDRQRSNIVKAAGTEYLESGNTQSGSRAASSSMSTGFFVNVDAIRVILEDIINFGAGPLPGLSEEIHDLNFEDEEECSYIVGSRVSPTEQLDNIPLIGDMTQQQVIPKHIKIANEVLKRLGYPELSPEEYDQATQVPVQNIGGRPDGAGQDPQARDDTMSRRLAAAEKKTPDATRPTRSAASYPWLKSTPA